MRLVQSLVLAFTIGVILAPKPVQAEMLSLGFGADYWFVESGLFHANLAIRTPVVRHFSVGGRFGLALATSPSTVAMPIDLLLRGDLGRMYLEGVVGPWLFFRGTTVRAHAGVGFGLQTRNLSVGIEVAYLDPDALLGLRVSFPL